MNCSRTADSAARTIASPTVRAAALIRGRVSRRFWQGCFVLAGLCPSLAPAATTWIGAPFGDWFEAANWAGGVPVQAGADALIDAGLAVIGDTNGNALAGRLTVGATPTGQLAGLGIGRSGLISASLTLGRDAGAAGLVTVGSAGTLWVYGTTAVGVAGQGQLSVARGGQVGSNGAIQIGQSVGSVGALTLNGGYWTAFYGGGDFDLGAGGTGSVTVSNGGLFQASGSMIVSLARNGGSATINVTGDGSVFSANSMIIDGPANLNLGPSGTIHAGILQAGAGHWSLAEGSLASFNDALLDDASALSFTLGSRDASGAGLFKANDLILDGSLTVELGAGVALLTGNHFRLLQWDNLSGRFDLVNLPTLGAGLAWDLSTLYTNGEIAVMDVGIDPPVTPVPEPGSWALTAIGLIALAGMARRRMRRHVQVLSVR